MMMIWRTPLARRALLPLGISVCLLLTAQAALAAPGSRLWVSRYDGPAHLDDGANAMGVSSDGSTVFVTGYNTGSNGSGDYATVAYDAATGAKLWSSATTARHRSMAQGSPSDGPSARMARALPPQSSIHAWTSDGRMVATSHFPKCPAWCNVRRHG
jgi:hypothetical protein